MVDDERARVLRMVAEGKLSPEEAADLLEALQPERKAPGVSFPEPPIPPGPPSLPNFGHRKRGRTVVIQVKEGENSKVNLRIPLNLAKAAGKFIPRRAQQSLENFDINLQDLLDDTADVDTGMILDVRDGDNRVLIAVE